jgi:hypothetical protein
MTFTKDQFSEAYERSVFSFFDLTGNLGGLFEILELSGSLFVGFFAGKIFLYSILSRLYQVDRYDGGDDKEKLGVITSLNEPQREVESNIHIDFRLNEP